MKNAKWPSMPLDKFVLAWLEGRSWEPSPRADKRTLIRRAYWNLTGLAPTHAQVQAFVTDGRQGVNYRAGTWHAIQSVLEREGEFLVVDRGGDGNNCEEYPLAVTVTLAE